MPSVHLFFHLIAAGRNSALNGVKRPNLQHPTCDDEIDSSLLVTCAYHLGEGIPGSRQFPEGSVPKQMEQPGAVGGSLCITSVRCPLVWGRRETHWEEYPGVRLFQMIGKLAKRETLPLVGACLVRTHS